MDITYHQNGGDNCGADPERGATGPVCAVRRSGLYTLLRLLPTPEQAARLQPHQGETCAVVKFILSVCVMMFVSGW